MIVLDELRQGGLKNVGAVFKVGKQVQNLPVNLVERFLPARHERVYRLRGPS